MSTLLFREGLTPAAQMNDNEINLAPRLTI